MAFHSNPSRLGTHPNTTKLLKWPARPWVGRRRSGVPVLSLREVTLHDSSRATMSEQVLVHQVDHVVLDLMRSPYLVGECLFAHHVLIMACDGSCNVTSEHRHRRRPMDEYIGHFIA